VSGLSLGLLTTFAAILAVQFIGKWVARARRLELESSLWVLIVVALLAARTSFVARHWRLYGVEPLTSLDIRDGGFHLFSGICAGLATAAVLGWRQRNKRVALFAGAGAGVAVFTLAGLVALVLPGPAVPLPQMTLTRLEGGTLALSSLAGKPVVLNLWASWCGPCRREMPVLRAAQLAHPEVSFVFVNQGETQEEIQAYLGKNAIALDNIVLDARPGLAKVLGAKALPTTFFFDAQGVLTERRVGELSAATLSEYLPRQ
jgi:thiol-disulfide isomerase/thioredoxin